VDGSQDSFRAADYAMKISAGYRADLFVTHIPEKHNLPQSEVTESKERQTEMNDA
jgi:hypothetical protein